MRHTQRRGSIYIFVLGITTLVMTIGVGAAMSSRILLERQRTSGRIMEADAAVRSGLELALATLNNSPNAILSLTRLELAKPTAFGDYQVSIAVNDPDDDTIGDDAVERIRVIALAERGDLRQYRSMIFEPTINPAAGQPAYRMIPGSYRIEFE